MKSLNHKVNKNKVKQQLVVQRDSPCDSRMMCLNLMII